MTEDTMTRLDRASGQALYRQIADDFRRRIRDGTLPEGARLPSERGLAETYEVSRVTASLAVAALKAEGLVVAEHGRGVFVRASRSLEEQLADCRQEVERLRAIVDKTLQAAPGQAKRAGQSAFSVTI